MQQNNNQTESFEQEWYLSYSHIEQIIKSRLYDDKENEIMILGCGLSNIGA